MTTSKIGKLLVVIGLSAIMGACATKDQEFYKRAPSVASLEVPPDLTRPSEDDTYEIPQIADVWKREPLLKDGSKVRLERDGSARWIVLTGKTDLYWERIREFWIERKTKLAWENRALGIMETDWVQNPDSRFSRDKFRVRLEPARAPDTMYLFLTHRGVQAEFNGNELVYTWTDRLSDPDLEVEVLGLLLEYLGLEPAPKKDVIAKAKKETNRAKLETDKPVPGITLDENKEQVWTRLTRAVDRMGHIIEESDQAKGTMKVRIDSESQNTIASFLGMARETYFLKLVEHDKNVEITVLTEEGKGDSSQAAVDYLTRLQKKL